MLGKGGKQGREDRVSRSTPALGTPFPAYENHRSFCPLSSPSFPSSWSTPKPDLLLPLTEISTGGPNINSKPPSILTPNLGHCGETSSPHLVP